MKYLFSAEGIDALTALHPAETLFGFDYDGTLAPLVDVPSEACMPALTASRLAGLSSSARTAIFSGRSIEDLKKRTAGLPLHLVGNHGLEGLPRHRGSLESAAQACRTWKGQLQQRLPKLGTPELQMEDKTYSLAIHLRVKRGSPLKREVLAATESLLPPARLIGGKQVVNLVPVGAPNKGFALTELLRFFGLSKALYVGDDETDEDVFSLLDPRIVGVRVGRRRRGSDAGFYIRNENQMDHLLAVLLEIHRHHAMSDDGDLIPT